MFVNYTVTINASNSEVDTSIIISDQTQASLEFLEAALADAGECVPVMFLVEASVSGAEDSDAAVLMETLPLCKRKLLNKDAFQCTKSEL